MLKRLVLDLTTKQKRAVRKELLYLGKPFTGRGTTYATKVEQYTKKGRTLPYDEENAWTIEHIYISLKQMLKDKKKIEVDYILSLLGIFLEDGSLESSTGTYKHIDSIRVAIITTKMLGLEHVIANKIHDMETIVRFGKKPLRVKDENLYLNIIFADDDINENCSKTTKYLILDIWNCLKLHIDRGYPLPVLNGLLVELGILLVLDPFDSNRYLIGKT